MLSPIGIVGPHSELTLAGSPGHTPGHWALGDLGDLGRVLLRTRSISSHHGTSQSSAVMSRVWGGGTGVVVPEN